VNISAVPTRTANGRDAKPSWSWGNAGVWILLVAGSFLQQPGRTTFDTKFDLTAGPAALLERALNLWSPASFGGLGNQAYGYLFPQGPFFLGAELLRMPDWVAQRLWSALVLVAAYEGARRLGRALGLPGWATVLAGLCYALSPRLLGAVGVLSAEVLPAAMLPWVVLPLVLALFSVLGVLTGILLRVRAFLYLGTTFLLLVIVTLIWHAVYHRGQDWIGYLAGIVLGVLIFTLFAVYEKRRQDVLRVLEDFRNWD